MNDFQITIVSGSKDSQPTPTKETHGFDVRQQSKGMERVLDDIESLAKVWDTVIEKLSFLASKADAVAGQYKMNEIEFNIGIEAGLNIGLVTKGNASVVVKFSKIP